MSEKVVAPLPPRDGREWDVQCARCGSSCVYEDCDYCGGEGYNESDDWQDDDRLIRCDVCRTRGGHWTCCSTAEYCEGHPNPGRESTTRGTLELFTFDSIPSRASAPPDAEER